MYNLLVVDDEPRIVNGLYEQFQDWKQGELGVYRAYSSMEALRILGTTKMDIVVTDIHMPGMSGIEMQKEIIKLWPRCHVIFLTGYSDFEYVQSAMRDGGLDYILKIEGDEPILAAVSKAIKLLQEELVSGQLLDRARQQLQAANSLIQKEYLTSLLQGELSAKSISQDRFNDMQIPLAAEEDVLLVIGRVDRWPDHISQSDQPLLMYAIQNVASEYLSTLASISFSMKPSHLILLIQPIAASRKPGREDCDKCLAFVQGMMSDIQETCRTHLQLPVSLAISSHFCSWTATAAQNLKLERLFQQGLGHGQEMLLTDLKPLEPSAAMLQGMSRQDIALKLSSIRHLETGLLSGQKDKFTEVYKDISETARILQTSPAHYSFVVEIQYALAAMYLAYINHWGFLGPVSEAMDIRLLLQGGSFRSWEEADAYYRELSDILFKQRTDDQKNRTQKVLMAVNQYIENHLSEDLSLEALASHVYLHPTYLSRLYKQITGVRISDYLKDMRLTKAKELLANPRMKIHEVAVLVGFESAHYFTKVFKKEMLVTPQEYRDRL
ncbi:response regulator [Paenibacillus sepulcri]|uniref:Response regulator n=1 Tax=Paenibacillus sepulcri TaxID=359917 RepID=A0ABS7BWF9_9BACL|nr:response regulator [Paenibacillus sepulcri]